ncbi:MAG: TIGR01440 family protein [Firmicutes bacterium]|nr:TIGR01440 family protein [Bacillota bacterium]
MLTEIGKQVRNALEELQAHAQLQPGDLLVVGGSTSEVIGQKIGTASNAEVAEQIVLEVARFCDKWHVQPAFQCCEHLNRALVVEQETVEKYDLDDVTVIPHPNAGGALASRALSELTAPRVVEHLGQRGKAGIDIGNTLIGMHLRPVVVPVRIETKFIGQAALVCARTRPKLIGGRRARYPE